VGSGDYLGWEELSFLMDHGIEIGNHTHTHDYFLDENIEKRQQLFIEDVQLAQKIINEKLNIVPKIFAYPYGEYDVKMKDNISKMGFIGAAAQNSGVISSYSDLYALPRFPMTDLYGKIPIFKEKIMMHPLPVVNTKPESTIAYQNPPELEFFLDRSDLSFSQMQCFIQGANCKIIALDSIGLSYRVVSDQALNSRRHLYTITVPDKDNKNWYWYSYQWVFPETSE
jgi:peptidoglycan/xylan/chitin deacetylase (PgdA/CDA1 family)